MGVCVVAGLTAFGGGTLRDILLDRRPFFWVQHAAWLWVLLALCTVAMLTLRARHFELTERAVLWPDALGLGLFSASGTQIALNMQMPAIVAVLMGAITAVFGGVLRDIVCNEIPSAFRDHRPYAVCAFIGAWVLVLAQAMNGPGWLGLTVAVGTTVLLRGLALWSGYHLPGGYRCASRGVAEAIRGTSAGTPFALVNLAEVKPRCEWICHIFEQAVCW